MVTESTSSTPGGSTGQEDQLAIDIQHQVETLMNEAKEEGVPIVGHVLEGMDNIGDGGGAAADPFTQVFSSGFGWIIDSVGFIKDPIDKLDGDAAAVQTAVDSMKHVTENLTYTAQGHQEDIPSLDDWEGQAGETYRSSMKLLRAEIVSLAYVVEGLGTLAAVSGSMVLTLRKIVRDLVATALGTIVIIVAAGVAAAIWTFGTSVAVAIASSVAVAVGVTVESMRRITKLKEALGRQTDRMGELETIAGDVADGLKRFEKSTAPHQSNVGSFPDTSGGSYSNTSGGYPGQPPGGYPVDSYAGVPVGYPSGYSGQPVDPYAGAPVGYQVSPVESVGPQIQPTTGYGQLYPTQSVNPHIRATTGHAQSDGEGTA